MNERIRQRIKRAFVALSSLALFYSVAAYVLLPVAWSHYEHQPALANHPMLSQTADGIPGDPMNIGLIGNEDDILKAFQATGWYPAAPITFRSGLSIVDSVVLNRPDHNAPVSPLFYEGRREDLAFELPSTLSARQRHHVRLWKVLDTGKEGRPVWLGAATYDSSVGLSRNTGEFTHRIAPDIDVERDFLSDELVQARMVSTTYSVAGIGPTLTGRNGDGSLYRTDGEIQILTLVENGRKQMTPVIFQAPSAAVQIKNAVFDALPITE
jgi:hypothetical protein